MIILDANGICHQCKHAMGHLSWNDKKVGIIFGFLNQMLSLAKILESNKFVFAWDSKESLRAKIFPDYKKSRRKDKTEEEKELDAISYAQFDLLKKEVLPEIGFVNSFYLEGYEADDIIASITSTNTSKTFTIVSSDEDLFQLLSDKVRMYSIRKKQFYTDKNLWKDYGVVPNEWAEVKAIAGCSSDGVPGVPGVGEVTACKFIRRQLSTKHQSYRNIQKHRSLIERNRKLVTLPFKNTPQTKLHLKETLSFMEFQNVCGRYGFQSFLEREKLKQWKEFVFKSS